MAIFQNKSNMGISWGLYMHFGNLLRQQYLCISDHTSKPFICINFVNIYNQTLGTFLQSFQNKDLIGNILKQMDCGKPINFGNILNI